MTIGGWIGACGKCRTRRHREVSECGVAADHPQREVGYYGVVLIGWAAGLCPGGLAVAKTVLFDIVNQVLMRSWARPFIAVCLTGKGFW